MLLHAALGGAGIAMLPSYLVSGLFAWRSLVLLPDCEPEVLGIHASYLSRKHQPLLLRTLLDFLAARCEGAPWDRDLPAATPALRKPRKSERGDQAPHPFLLFGKCPLDHKVARGGGVAFLEAALFQHVLQIDQHAGAAAGHDAVIGGIELGQAPGR